MKKEYDFTKARKNPYAKHFKQQITIRLDRAMIDYFKTMARSVGVTYQNLINLYLLDCMRERRRPMMKWLKNSA